MPNSEMMLKQSTQVAYLNCLEKGEKNLILNGKKGPFSIKQLILATIDIDSIRDKLEETKLNGNEKIFQKIIMQSDLDIQDKQIITRFEDEVLNWKIAYIHNMTDINGFYGCVIETSDYNAIVCFRGSEGFEDYAGLVYDWVQSDLGLLNQTETIQTIETEQFAIILNERNVLDKYETIDVTGHSLGGNLASHFAVVCASREETRKIFDKIGRAYNFDGPGVSDEYIHKNRNNIDKVAEKITHYKWSPIGSLLYNLPGENEVFLKTRKYYGDGGFKDRIRYYTFGKHDTKSLIFDKNGMAIRGKEGFLAKKLKKLSLDFEQIPTITNAIYALAASTIGKLIYKKKDGKIGFKLPFVNKFPNNRRGEVFEYQDLKLKYCDMVNVVVEQVKEYVSDEYIKNVN
ncbi:MAG: DUF2974 domain-containing protein [Clostridia bacterium]|nr:DUF2974 domain-containing protein [Clostridia bacterium]